MTNAQLTPDNEQADGLLRAVQTVLAGDQVAHIYRFKGAQLGDGRRDVTVVVIGDDRADCAAIYDAIDLGIEAGRAPHGSAA